MGWMVAFIAAPLSAVLEVDETWRRERGQQAEVGDPVAFPACLSLLSRYGVRRVRDRFNRELLGSSLSALGVWVDHPAWFGAGVRIRRHVSWPTNPETRKEAAARLRIIGG